jgi:predicted O-methyltransferase YrrM
MKNAAIRIKAYLRYIFSRKGRHAIHSPFVYDFVEHVLCDHTQHADYKRIIDVRKRNFTNNNVIETVDFGAAAGNKKFLTYRIAVNKLAKKRANEKKVYFLLNKIARYFKPAQMLELGTSVGIATTALALGNPKGKVVTIEGCASVASVAESNFNRFEFSNIEQVIGNFDHTLPIVLENIKTIDLLFVDGNHRKKPTLKYFKKCLPKTGEDSVFIFGDIHWSEEMEQAWEQIRNDERVSISLDLYHVGLVFFRQGLSKQHFVLHF